MAACIQYSVDDAERFALPFRMRKRVRYQNHLGRCACCRERVRRANRDPFIVMLRQLARGRRGRGRWVENCDFGWKSIERDDN